MSTDVRTPQSDAETDVEHRFGEEFEHVPVPTSHRRSLFSVSAVWLGFPMILTNAVFGGVIVYGLGIRIGLLAMIAGSLLLFAYVGALSFVAGHSGNSFALIAARTFGGRGARIVAGFLSTVVIGWFAFQTGLTGSTLHAALGWNQTWTIVLAGVLYTAVTFIGIRALSVIGIIAAPLFIGLGIVAVVLAVRQGSGGAVFSYGGAGTLSFGAAVTIVFAGFADSGTMTADFTRWSRTGREAVIATFAAFPVANLIALVAGGLIVALGAATDPAVNGGDFLGLLTQHGSVLTAAAVVFVFVNLGSVCSHCLYNGAVGWSHITGGRMRTLTLVLGAIGLVVAAAGVWSYFADWLNVLGVVVPPIGAVLIVDQLMLRARSMQRASASLRMSAFAAWGIGSLAAALSYAFASQLSVAAVGLVAGALAYGLIEALSGRAFAVNEVRADRPA